MPIQSDRSSRLVRARLALAVLTMSNIGIGCALAPKSQLEDARKRVQSLQADNQRLREVALNIRGRNRELAQRAIDDARLLQAREDAVREYETSLAAARADREELLGLVDEIRTQVRSASSGSNPRRE